MTSRFFGATLVVAAPLVAMAACGGSDAIRLGDDAAADGALDDVSTLDDATTEDATVDAGDARAHADGSPTDAASADAAKTLNRCGGYEKLELAGHFVTPGDSCGTCSDGTVVCIGSDSVACAGATAPPCSTPPFDAGPNACGGYGPLTFQSAPAALGDPCGECGQIQCASNDSLACTSAPGACATDAGLQSTCILPADAFTAEPTATLPAETRPSTTSRTSVGIPTSDLAFDPADGLIYASIPQSISQGNSIAAIDPTSGTVLRTVYVGAAPSRISISDDGKALWVLFSTGSYGYGPYGVRRVDLTTFTAGTTITLPPSSSVTDIQVVPGTEDSVAVSRYEGYPTNAYSVVVFDNGVPRPYGSRSSYQTSLVGSGSGSLLFSGGANGYPYDVSSLCVDGNGAFFHGYAGPWSYNETPFFYGGVIYHQNGTADDAKTGSLLHTFTVPSATYTAVTADTNDVYYLTSTYQSSSYWVQVVGFDRSTYASTTTDLLQTNGGSVQSFIRWGRYGFAYLDSSSFVEIVRSTIIPDMP